MTAPQELDIRANGISIRYRIEVREGAPWLVFSNSLMTNLSLWDDQVAAFADRYRILRYDQRGHGGTGSDDRRCSFDLLVDRVGPRTRTAMGALAALISAIVLGMVVKDAWDQVIAGLHSYSPVIGYPLAIAAAATSPFARTNG